MADNKKDASSGKIQLEDNSKVLDSLRNAILEVQDGADEYRNILRSTNREIKKSEDAFRRIQSRINAYSKETVNVKEVENELFKAKQQQELSQLAANRMRKKALEMGKDEFTLAIESRALEQQIAELEKSKGKRGADARNKKIAELKSQQALVDNMKFAIEAQDAQTKLAEQNVKELQSAVEVEKSMSKQIGVRAGFMQKIGKALGVEDEVRRSINSEIRKGIEVEDDGTVKVTKRVNALKVGYNAIGSALVKNLKSMSAGTIAVGALGLAIKGVGKVGDLAGAGMSRLGGTIRGLTPDASTFFSEMTGPVKDLLKNIPIVGGLLSGIVDVFSGVLDLVIGVDNRITKASRQLGMSVEQGKALNTQFQAMASNSDKVYVNTRKYWETFGEIAKMNGLNNMVSKEFLETNIELAEFAGLEADTRMGLLNTAKITGQTAKATTEQVLGQVYALEQATGLSFNQQGILKEVTSLGGRLGLEFSKYPDKLTKAVLQTKAMGLELKELNSMADSFLDFESSISKEFEAQLLTGRDINLMKARELFLNNDLAGAAAEITRQVGSTGEFLKMNRIQQESFAGAMGMSVDQMSEMLKKQELYSKFAVTDQKGLLKKIELMRQEGNLKQAAIKAGGEEALQNLINLSLQDKLMQSFDKIKESLVDFLTSENVLNKIQEFVNFLSDPKNIRSMIDSVRGYVADILRFIGRATAEILEIVGNIGNFFTFGEKGNKFERNMDKMARGVRESTSIIEESLRRDIGKTDAQKQTAVPITKKTVDDAVIFPNNNMVINKDPLDYTIFTKNPAALSQPSPQIDMNQLAIAITSALNQRPMQLSLNANLAMDGQPTAKVVVTSIKNSVITGFDRQSGPMSQNS